MAFCDHCIFEDSIPSNDPCPCGDMHNRLMCCKEILHIYSLAMESFLEKYRAQCYNLLHFEMRLTTLRAKMRRTMKVKNPHYPIAEKSEEDSHDLHLAWCDETSQFMSKLNGLKPSQAKGRRWM
ncbi:hypothetical protein RDI58_019956 [Solanum bulbocastanum]|uniref:Uncharacterized protein n=1 Tax=Solanum bulbocastanum TaxID=147425 RepID=A0AAN8T7R8_SOLBU